MYAYRLLRNTRPSVVKVFTAIQNMVMSFSRSGIEAASVGVSYLGSSSSSFSSCDSRGSMLSTRPSVDGRFSAAQDVSFFLDWVARRESGSRWSGHIPIAAVWSGLSGLCDVANGWAVVALCDHAVVKVDASGSRRGARRRRGTGEQRRITASRANSGRITRSDAY